jgi:hypothetical protein
VTSKSQFKLLCVFSNNHLIQAICACSVASVLSSFFSNLILCLGTRTFWCHFSLLQTFIFALFALRSSFSSFILSHSSLFGTLVEGLFSSLFAKKNTYHFGFDTNQPVPDRSPLKSVAHARSLSLSLLPAPRITSCHFSCILSSSITKAADGQMIY